MEKIPTLFKRDHGGNRLVRNEITPGAEWVVAGEGVATRKYDGTCCRWKDGRLWKRYELKPDRVPPVGFEAAQAPDNVTGEIPGWVPVGDGPEDFYHRDGLNYNLRHSFLLEEGTYELCGPKVQGNKEHETEHVLIRHGREVLEDAPRTFNELALYIESKDIEGVVWHHPDGRMVKIKGRDFGIKR